MLAYLSRCAAAPDIAAAAEAFGCSYGEAAGVISFYSRFNGLPQEERLEPMLRSVGPLLRHAMERPWHALERCLASPGLIIDELERSGLCGRGGAGFPTARKWRAIKNSGSRERLIVCNVSEGEPGTAKDLFLLLNYPEAVLEGMAICAAATDCKSAFIYVRNGYSNAADSIRSAAERFRPMLRGLAIEVIETPGAYVCGEETALISSLEGRRGEARLKPPYPVEAGLFGVPTVINNAETFAAAALVLDCGAERFLQNESRLFTVTGCGASPAICEMPVTVSPSELFSAAGCTAEPKAFMLGGGASGRVFPSAFMSVPLSSQEAVRAGMLAGSGSVRFISGCESLRSICIEIIEFYSNESCGKCTPCRFGSRKLLQMLRSGSGAADISELSECIAAGAFCPLGKSLGNALLSALRYFPHEFESVSPERCRI